MNGKHLLASEEVQMLIRKKQIELSEKCKVKVNMENITNIAIKEGIDTACKIIEAEIENMTNENRIIDEETKDEEINEESSDENINNDSSEDEETNDSQIDADEKELKDDIHRLFSNNKQES